MVHRQYEMSHFDKYIEKRLILLPFWRRNWLVSWVGVNELGLFNFKWLTDDTPACHLFSTGTSTNLFCILPLYNQIMV